MIESYSFRREVVNKLVSLNGYIVNHSQGLAQIMLGENPYMVFIEKCFSLLSFRKIADILFV